MDGAWQVTIQKWLRLLQYPSAHSVDKSIFQSKDQLQHLVCWIEDRKIRAWKIEDRSPLRQHGPAWHKAFSRYLKDLSCPIQWTGVLELQVRALTFLVQRAIAYDFEDANNNHQVPSDQSPHPKFQALDPLSKIAPDVNTDNVESCAFVCFQLLYLDQLRALQDQAVTLSVRVQEYTANPKTNSTLGKVGI